MREVLQHHVFLGLYLSPHLIPIFGLLITCLLSNKTSIINIALDHFPLLPCTFIPAFLVEKGEPVLCCCLHIPWERSNSPAVAVVRNQQHRWEQKCRWQLLALRWEQWAVPRRQPVLLGDRHQGIVTEMSLCLTTESVGSCHPRQKSIFRLADFVSYCSYPLKVVKVSASG